MVTTTVPPVFVNAAFASSVPAEKLVVFVTSAANSARFAIVTSPFSVATPSESRLSAEKEPPVVVKASPIPALPTIVTVPPVLVNAPSVSREPASKLAALVIVVPAAPVIAFVMFTSPLALSVPPASTSKLSALRSPSIVTSAEVWNRPAAVAVAPASTVKAALLSTVVASREPELTLIAPLLVRAPAFSVPPFTSMVPSLSVLPATSDPPSTATVPPSLVKRPVICTEPSVTVTELSEVSVPPKDIVPLVFTKAALLTPLPVKVAEPRLSNVPDMLFSEVPFNVPKFVKLPVLFTATAPMVPELKFCSVPPLVRLPVRVTLPPLSNVPPVISIDVPPIAPWLVKLPLESIVGALTIPFASTRRRLSLSMEPAVSVPLITRTMPVPVFDNSLVTVMSPPSSSITPLFSAPIPAASGAAAPVTFTAPPVTSTVPELSSVAIVDVPAVLLKLESLSRCVKLAVVPPWLIVPVLAVVSFSASVPVLPSVPPLVVVPVTVRLPALATVPVLPRLPPTEDTEDALNVSVPGLVTSPVVTRLELKVEDVLFV